MADHQYRRGDYIAGEFLVEDIFGGTGRSGMGVVYLVRSREVPFPFVLKTFQGVEIGGEGERRFRQEAEAWVRLGLHPNVVRAYWVRRLDDRLFVAAEYIKRDGEGRNSVQDYLEQGQVPLSAVARWIAQFCYGMGLARRSGLHAHRDIKPDNLMVTPQGDLKVTDFGLARIWVKDADSPPISEPSTWPDGPADRVTQSAAAMGTLRYMAPEQFMDARIADHRSDIYSFGVVLFQILSGGLYPFQIPQVADDPVSTFASLHLHAPVAPLPSPLLPIVKRCLEKQMDRRYQTYEELHAHLTEICQRLGIAVPRPPAEGAGTLEELYVLAQSYAALGKPSDALRAIDQYIAKVPDASWAWTERSRILLESMDDAKAAVESAKRSLRIYAYNSHAWNNLGCGLSRLQRWDESLDAFQRALDCDPFNSGAMMNMSEPLIQLRRFQEAADSLSRALSLCPTKSTLLFNAGNIAALLLQRGALPAATSLLRCLVKVQPDNVNAWHNLGLAYQAAGRLGEAIGCFERVNGLTPTDSFALRTLARLYGQDGRFAEALECCERLLRSKQEITAAVAMKAQLLSFLGRQEEAVQTLNDALRNLPRDDTLWFVLATLLEQQGRLGEALPAAIECRRVLLARTAPPSPQNLHDVEGMIRRLSRRS